MSEIKSKLASLVFMGAAAIGLNDDAMAQQGHNHDHHQHHMSVPVNGDRIIKKSPIKDVSLEGTVDFNGKPVKDSDFAFKKRLVFFGFTTCPNVCPIGMATLAQSLKQFEQKFGKSFFDNTDVLLVSTDPKNDTPQRMKEWLGHFHPKITGITGKPERLQEIAKNYRADQMGHHSPFLYVLDEGGRFERLINTQKGVNEVVQALEESYGICKPPQQELQR